MFIYSAETVITAILIIVFILLKTYLAIKDWWEQRNCAHERYRETMSCDAICNSCNKNLGFIGNIRDKEKAV